MAIIDNETEGRGYPLPNAANKLKDDVERLIGAVEQIDADMVSVNTALGGKAATSHTHGMSAVTGLEDALAGKMDADVQLELGELANVEIGGATNGQVLIKQGEDWIPLSLQVNNVANLETLLGQKAVASDVTTALGLKADKASPTFTGTPAAPTADAGTNTTQIATTAFVGAAITALRDGVASAYDTLAKLAAAVLNRALRIETQPNISVNGSLIDSQENGDTLGTANGFFYADQHALYKGTLGVSAQRVAYTSLAGGRYAAEIKCTTAKTTLGATDLVTDTEAIEGSRPEFVAAGWGAAGAKQFVHRFECQKPAGTYSVHVTNSAGNRHCYVQYTVTPGEANTPVIKEVVIPGDTSGTWPKGDGQIGVVIDHVEAAGSTYVGGAAGVWGATAYYAGSGQKNFLDSTSNVARHTDFGMRLDPDATGVYGRYVVGELDAVYRSERYFDKSYSSGILPGAGSSAGALSTFIIAGSGAAGTVVFNISFKTRMSKTPTVTPYSTSGAINTVRDNTGSDRAAAASAGFISEVSAIVINTVAGNGGASYFCQWTANARLS